MRISEVAEQLGVAPSTVRYYERIGLVPSPPRTPSGYRSYDDEATARLLFITRAKRIGLTLEQIAEVLPIWNGVNCAATHEEITRLIEVKKAEVQERMPHWGVVLKGKLKFTDDSGETIIQAGEAYYVAPGHLPYLYAGTEVIEFSPTTKLQDTLAVVEKNMAEAG